MANQQRESSSVYVVAPRRSVVMSDEKILESGQHVDLEEADIKSLLKKKAIVKK